MGRPYSEDLRVRVDQRVEAGYSVREVAETFAVGVARVANGSSPKRHMAVGGR